MTLMVWTASLTGLVGLGIFVAGLAIGWIAAKASGGTSALVRDLSVQANLPSGTMPGGIRISKSVVRRLTLKCQCGSEWHFAEGSGPLPADAKPSPTGETFECPNCGRGIDLKAERKIEAETLAGLNLPKTS